MPDRRPAPGPLHRRVLQTFLSPRELFRTFGEEPPWLGPLLLSVAVGMVLVAAAPDAAFVEPAEGAVTRRGEPVEITSSPEEIARFGRLFRLLVILAWQPFLAFGAAGVLALVFSVLLRGEGAYRQYLAITTHVFLITAAGSLAALAVAALRGAELAPVSPALLLPAESGSLPFRFLAGIDIFSLWALAVAGMGVSLVNRRRSCASAAGILVGGYLLVVAALAALPA